MGSRRPRSRRRCCTSERPEPVFFTDRDLGKSFPECLRAARLKVERHDDHFRPDCSDEEWLERVGKNQWVAISHDARIRYKPNELVAVIRHEVRLLVVVGKVPLLQLARNFVATMPRIRVFLERREAPFIAKVYLPSAQQLRRDSCAMGTIVLWYS
jgi:hypothetical protein